MDPIHPVWGHVLVAFIYLPPKGGWQQVLPIGPRRENRQTLNFVDFLICLVHEENGLRWPQMGPEGFFPTNQDLANILGRTYFDFENVFFLGGVANLWMSRSQNAGFPDFQKSGFPGLQKIQKNKGPQNTNTFCSKCRQGLN